MRRIPEDKSHGKSAKRILLYGVRQRDAQVGGEVPRLRGVEHGGGTGGGAQGEVRPFLRRQKHVSFCKGDLPDGC